MFTPYIDEVESLTAARAGAMAGTEPSDGLRVSISSSIYSLVYNPTVGRECAANATR